MFKKKTFLSHFSMFVIYIILVINTQLWIILEEVEVTLTELNYKYKSGDTPAHIELTWTIDKGNPDSLTLTYRWVIRVEKIPF